MVSFSNVDWNEMFSNTVYVEWTAGINAPAGWNTLFKDKQTSV